MKKILLTAACLFFASHASAMTLTGITMDFYDASGTYTGYHTDVFGSIDTTAATGHLYNYDYGIFFGYGWVADVKWASETPGANTWSGTDALPSKAKTGYNYTSFTYNFNLAAGDIAVGLFFDWSTNLDIPVLAVFHPEADGSYSAVDQVWTDYYGRSGTGMQTSPFPGQWPAFSAAVPEPASMLLIGAGLAGLVGVRRRKR